MKQVPAALGWHVPDTELPLQWKYHVPPLAEEKEGSVRRTKRRIEAVACDFVHRIAILTGQAGS